MTQRFLNFIKIIIDFENGSTVNGYVANDSMDKNVVNENICGITRLKHPSLNIWESLDELTTVAEKKAYELTEDDLNEIYQVYHDEYYVILRTEEFTDEQLALHVFDMGVNAGVERSAKILQEIIGVEQDGIITPEIVTAANSNEDVLELFKKGRIEFYNNLIKKDFKREKFLYGWLRRVHSCKI